MLFYLSLTVLCRPRSTSPADIVSFSVWVELLIMFQFLFDLGFNELISSTCWWSMNRHKNYKNSLCILLFVMAQCRKLQTRQNEKYLDKMTSTV